MFEPTLSLIDLMVDTVEAEFSAAHAPEDSAYSAAVTSVARTVLPRIASSNALFHNVHHTLLVTLVGLDLLHAKQAVGEGVPPAQWADFVASLLCHDAGFAPRLCAADGEEGYASGRDGEVVSLPPEATDAALAPYHVDRGILFVREHFSSHPLLDADRIAANIERTRFPVPDHELAQRTDDLPGLARAADLLAQSAEHFPRRRYPALFYEFAETGLDAKLGYKSPRDLARDFPRFFDKIVARYCGGAMRLLEATERGRRRLENLENQLEATRSGTANAVG